MKKPGLVVDTSILLFIYFKETYADWAAEELNKNAEYLYMSTVNLTETLIRLADRQLTNYIELKDKLLNSKIQFVSPDIIQAEIAARARIDHPLNIGDCFVYALAYVQDCPIISLDKDFKSLNWPLIFPAKK